MSSTIDEPTYLLEANWGVGSSGWILGSSTLGSTTTLLTPTVANTIFIPASGILSFKTTRGRQDQLTQMNGGTMEIVLDNFDGRYSPANVNSPYYPNLLPQRTVRLSAIYGGLQIFLFYGYVQGFQPTDNGPVDANMTLTCSDWFESASRALVNASFAQANEWQYVVNVLNATDTRSQPSAVDTDSSDTLLAHVAQNESPLQIMNGITEATRGSFYVAGDGTITYHSRKRVWGDLGPFANAGYVFTQPDPTIANPVYYLDQNFVYDLSPQDIYNEVRVHASGTNEGEQVVSDTTSIGQYGRRTLSIQNSYMVTGNAFQLANSIAQGYKDAFPRLRAISVHLDAIPSLAAKLTVLQIDVDDTVRVIKKGPGSLGIDVTAVVQSVAHDYNKLTGHTLTFQLVDKRVYGRASWRLGYSRLGLDTYINY